MNSEMVVDSLMIWSIGPTNWWVDIRRIGFRKWRMVAVPEPDTDTRFFECEIIAFTRRYAMDQGRIRWETYVSESPF